MLGSVLFASRPCVRARILSGLLGMLGLAAGAIALAVNGASAEAWSDPAESDIVISEIHYHPLLDGGEGEFVELHNRGSRRVDLSGWELRGGVTFVFPEGSSIGPLGWIVVAGDAASLVKANSDARCAGSFDGRLANDGELVLLVSRRGRVVDRVRFRDGSEDESSPWPREADGNGPSLERIDLSSRADGEPFAWAPSLVIGGTPGRPNASPQLVRAKAAERGARARLNEARVVVGEGFIEIAAGTEGPVDLDGCRLLSFTSSGAVEEHGLSGKIAAERFLVVGSKDAPGLFGDDVRALVLLDREELWIDTLHLPRAPLRSNESFGRSPDRGEAAYFLRPTPGRSNASPERSPLVISEILYHPRGDAPDDELIEIHNRGTERVSLAGARLSGAVRYELPADAAIEPGEYMVIAKSPDSLRGRLGANVRGSILGPFEGRLGNRSEEILLLGARGEELDRVRYRDRAPWPLEADGEGFSIELIDPELDNSFGEAWVLGPPGGSPGRASPRTDLASRTAPIVVAVRHSPALPAPGDTIEIRATILSRTRITSASALIEGVSGGARSRPSRLRLRAEPVAPDRAAVFTGRFRIPAGPELVAFRIEARDQQGGTVVAPSTAPSLGAAEPSSNAYLIGVEKSAEPRPALPRYRVLLLPEDVRAWGAEDRGRSERTFPCTFIVSFDVDGRLPFERVYHQATIRYRGNSSRRPTDGAMSFRLELGAGDLFDGRNDVILNGYFPERQIAAARVFRHAGLVVPSARPVDLFVSGRGARSYAHVEPVDRAFADEEFDGEDGAFFRGTRDRSGGAPADLSFRGTDPEIYGAAYRLETGPGSAGEKLVELLRAIAEIDSNDIAASEARIAKVLDPRQWGAYFAANHVLGNTEGGLSTGAPDDYYLYTDARGRFLLVPWDNDSTFDDPGRPHAPTSPLPAVDRLLAMPSVARGYHDTVRHLLDGSLRAEVFARTIADLRGAFPGPRVEALSSFVDARHRAVRSSLLRLPLAMVLPVGETGDDVTGESFGTLLAVPEGMRPVRLGGYAEPSIVAGVTVGGQPADWDPVRGFWTVAIDAIPPRESPLWVDHLDASGARCGGSALSILSGARIAPLAGRSISRDESISSEGGIVWRIDGEVAVEPQATLRLAPGTILVGGPSGRLVVRGKLIAEGAPESPVWFSSADGRRPWLGIFAEGARASVRLAQARFEGVAAAGSAAGAAVMAQGGASLSIERVVVRGSRGAGIVAISGEHSFDGVTIVDGASGIVLEEAKGTVENTRLERLSGDGLSIRAAAAPGIAVAALTVRDALGAGLHVRDAAVELETVELSACGRGIDATGRSDIVLRGGRLAGNDVAIVVGESARNERTARSGAPRVEIIATEILPHVELWRVATGAKVVWRGAEVPTNAPVPAGVELLEK